MAIPAAVRIRERSLGCWGIFSVVEPLTYTEEQILSFLREGRYDAEIAVRLGISNAEVARRIEAICRKTGLPDKTALRRAPGTAAANPVEHEAASDAEPEAVERDRSRAGWPMAILGALATIAVVAGVAMLALRRSEPDATSFGANEWTLVAESGIRAFVGTPSPPATAISNTIDGAVPNVMTRGAPVALPADVEMLYTTREGADRKSRLLRAYRSAPGNQQLATDVLYAPPDGFDLVDVLSTNDGSDIVVQIGLENDDGRGPVEAHFFRSKDGGVTWVPAGPSQYFPRTNPGDDRGASLAAFDGDDVLLAIHYGQESRYETLNGGNVVADEGESAVPWTDTTWARVVPSPSGPGYVVGQRTYSFGPDATYGIHEARLFEARGLIAAAWPTNATGFVGVYGLDGKVTSVTETGVSTIMSVVGWLDPMNSIATFLRQGTLWPVVFTPATGEMRELRLFDDGSIFQEVIAVRTGPAAVVAPAETCLPLFEWPDADSPVMFCAAPGVRLVASGLQARRVDGKSWYGMTIGQFGPVGWVRPGPALWFDDPSFAPQRDNRYGNLVAIVRPSGGSECAEVHQSAGETAPVVACLQAGKLIGHALNPLGLAGEQQWYAVFYPTTCFPVTGCVGDAIGFIREEYLGRQP